MKRVTSLKARVTFQYSKKILGIKTRGIAAFKPLRSLGNVNSDINENGIKAIGECWERSRCKDVYVGAPPFGVLFFAIRCLQKGKIDPNLLPQTSFRPRDKKVKKPIFLRAQAKQRTR